MEGGAGHGFLSPLSDATRAELEPGAGQGRFGLRRDNMGVEIITSTILAVALLFFMIMVLI